MQTSIDMKTKDNLVRMFVDYSYMMVLKMAKTRPYNEMYTQSTYIYICNNSISVKQFSFFNMSSDSYAP